jgi:hypothetical protein
MSAGQAQHVGQSGGGLGGFKRKNLSVVALVAAVLLVWILVHGLQTADAHWTGAGVPAGHSLAGAPVLRQQARVRGRVEPGDTLYLKVDPAARGKLDYAIDGVGPFIVDAVTACGQRVTVVDPRTRESAPDLSQPDWLLARQSWGHGSSVGAIQYFVVKSVPGRRVEAAYEFTLFSGPDGYQP